MTRTTPQSRQSRSILSIASTGSVLSIGSAGSVLSIGSVGSVLSIGSAGSVGSLGSVGSAGCVGSALSVGSIGSVLGAGALGSGCTCDVPGYADCCAPDPRGRDEDSHGARRYRSVTDPSAVVAMALLTLGTAAVIAARRR